MIGRKEFYEFAFRFSDPFNSATMMTRVHVLSLFRTKNVIED